MVVGDASAEIDTVRIYSEHIGQFSAQAPLGMDDLYLDGKQNLPIVRLGVEYGCIALPSFDRWVDQIQLVNSNGASSVDLSRLNRYSSFASQSWITRLAGQVMNQSAKNDVSGSIKLADMNNFGNQLVQALSGMSTLSSVQTNLSPAALSNTTNPQLVAAH